MTQFIAEIGSNHNGTLDRARALVEAAASIGCTGVKFQYFRANKLYREEEDQRKVRRFEVPDDWLPILARDAHHFGLICGYTIYDHESPRMLDKLAPRPDFLKISSYSLLTWQIRAGLDNLHVPVIMVATGMASARELQYSRWSESRTVLLHCVSTYPVDISSCNLAAIETLRTMHPKLYGYGWSDHSRSEAVLLRAALHYNVDVIEAHLDLNDGRGSENQGHSWRAKDLARVIGLVRTGERADGDGRKEPQPCELAERDWRADPSDGLRPMRSAR